MLRFQIDSNGSYSVRLPRSKRHLYMLAVAFVNYEETLAPTEQTTFTPEIISLVEQVNPLFRQQQTGEAQRVQASESLKRYEQEARELARQIRSLMQLKFPKTPELATEWGFEVRQSGLKRGSILLPLYDREALLVLLDTYVGVEMARPEGEQFTMPSLETVRKVRDGLAVALEARQAGQAQREASVALTNDLNRELQDYLNAALVYLVMKRFKRRVTPELQVWGFDVVEIRSSTAAADDDSQSAS